MSTAARQYVVCVRAEDAGDLEVRKLYELRDDAVAAAQGFLRVVDESGEDYLYPAEWFVAVTLSAEAARLLRAPGRRRPAAPRARPGLQRTAPSRRR